MYKSLVGPLKERIKSDSYSINMNIFHIDSFIFILNHGQLLWKLLDCSTQNIEFMKSDTPFWFCYLLAIMDVFPKQTSNSTRTDFQLRFFKLANLGSNELKQNLNSQTLGQTNLSKMGAVSTDLFVDVTFARTYLDCRLRQIKPENKCLTIMLRSMTLSSWWWVFITIIYVS